MHSDQQEIDVPISIKDSLLIRVRIKGIAKFVMPFLF